MLFQDGMANHEKRTPVAFSSTTPAGQHLGYAENYSFRVCLRFKSDPRMHEQINLHLLVGLFPYFLTLALPER